MKILTFLSAALFLSGCARVASNTSSAYLADDVGDAPPNLDIVRANFTELNGSLVVRVELQNYNASVPLLVARLTTDTGTFGARLVPDPTKPTPPRVRAEVARVDADPAEQPRSACWLPSYPANPRASGPWLILLEWTHDLTALEGGGEVRALELSAVNEDGVVQDRASATGRFAVHGGANPYAPDCPLNHERARALPDF